MTVSKRVGPSRAPRPLSLVTRAGAGVPDDADVGRALIAGETWAQRETWQRMAPMVLSMAQRCLGSRSDAEDLTQEVFYRLFRKSDTLRDPHSLRSFVYSFAIRVLKSELRRRNVRAWLSFGSPEATVQAPAVAPDMELRDQLARFYRLLDRLGARDRLVFVLRRIEGMTAEEIAGHMSVSLSTVKRSIKYSEDAVSRWLQEDPRLKDLGMPEVVRP